MNTSLPWTRIFRVVWLVFAGPYLIVTVLGLTVVGSFVGDFAGQPIELPNIVLAMLTVTVSFALATLLYVRGRNDTMALYFSFFLLLYGVSYGGPLGWLTQRYLGSTALSSALASLLVGAPLTILLLLFPNGRPATRFLRAMIPVAALSTVAFAAYTILTPSADFRDSWDSVQTVLNLPLLVALAGSVWRFRRHATLAERQQMKWGLYSVGLFVLFAGAAANLNVRLVWFLSINAIPIFFTIAILLGKLWNIDLIIRRTLQYGIVTAILGGVYFGGVTLLQSLFASITGSDSTLAVVISTLVIAALFRPLQTRIQRFIDRRFFRQKYDAAQTLADFADAVRDEIDVEDVEAALLRAIDETMQPESVGLWLREGSES